MKHIQSLYRYGLLTTVDLSIKSEDTPVTALNACNLVSFEEADWGVTEHNTKINCMLALFG